MESLCDFVVVLFIGNVLDDDRWDWERQGKKDIVSEIVDRKATKDHLEQWWDQPIKKC